MTDGGTCLARSSTFRSWSIMSWSSTRDGKSACNERAIRPMNWRGQEINLDLEADGYTMATHEHMYAEALVAFSQVL
jgi:hypothetical protein